MQARSPRARRHTHLADGAEGCCRGGCCVHQEGKDAQRDVDDRHVPVRARTCGFGVYVVCVQKQQEALCVLSVRVWAGSVLRRLSRGSTRESALRTQCMLQHACAAPITHP
jgi:hypothetical protein